MSLPEHTERVLTSLGVNMTCDSVIWAAFVSVLVVSVMCTAINLLFCNTTGRGMWAAVPCC